MSKQIIDISEWQAPSVINYDGLAVNVSLAIIRIQYGTNYIDKHYKTHIAEFKKRGVPVNVYAWVRGVSVDDMKAEARDFYSRATGLGVSFYWLDLEERSMADMRVGSSAYAAELKRLGAGKVGAYIAHHLYAPFNINAADFDAIWIPHYGRNDGTINSAPQYPCDLHQFTSEGRLPGYNGPLDLNRLMGTKPLEFFTDGKSGSGGEPGPTNPVVPNVPQGALPVGKVVTVKKTATNWADGSTVADFVKGSTYSIIEAREYNKSFSKFAYVIGLNGAVTGLILEQDLIESGVQNGFESAPVGTVTDHKVVFGDTLSEIAIKYGVTVDSLVANNASLIKDKNDIKVGWILRIKSDGAPTQSEVTYHTVKSGDVLGQIAIDYGTSIAALQRINTDLTNPNAIFVGQRIRVK
ncbi:LysM peptidoglycan-binding domain-containing protein [Carnobacterium maltaromaticum]|uniref:LysM peptidoglycan-binding domain-containing protein n=1 Tax=Carnobacterium maltaromaticum TaxID=2751 RepID=UPI0039BEBA85